MTDYTPDEMMARSGAAETEPSPEVVTLRGSGADWAKAGETRKAAQRTAAKAGFMTASWLPAASMTNSELPQP